MEKLKVAILFGGKSGEHEVSISSAVSVFNALDKSKYDVWMIGIDKAGRWLLPSRTRVLAHAANPRLLKLNEENDPVSFIPFEAKRQFIEVETTDRASTEPAAASMPRFGVIIPILHGPHGEDGTVQGLLELGNVPYVGAGVLGSAIGMDKDVSRRLLAVAGIPVVPTLVVRKHEFQNDRERLLEQAEKSFGYPYFVKPANMGSSVGVAKVKAATEAFWKISDAFSYDTKVLLEKAIDARELECSVLGNHEPRASIVGEIEPRHEFYSYEAKYIDEHGAALIIPANLPIGVADRIRELSLLAFRTLECSGMARVDFFLDRENEQLYLNEINTIPGFTKISMYPKLWEASGLAYSALIDELIRLAIERHGEKNALRISYEPAEE